MLKFGISMYGIVIQHKLQGKSQKQKQSMNHSPFSVIVQLSLEVLRVLLKACKNLTVSDYFFVYMETYIFSSKPAL